MLKILLYTLLINSMLLSAQISDDISLEVAKNTFIRYHESKNINNFDLKNIDIIKSENEPIIYIYQYKALNTPPLFTNYIKHFFNNWINFNWRLPANNFIKSFMYIFF